MHVLGHGEREVRLVEAWLEAQLDETRLVTRFLDAFKGNLKLWIFVSHLSQRLGKQTSRPGVEVYRHVRHDEPERSGDFAEVEYQEQETLLPDT
jgi:hypothetical protein